MNTVKGLLIGEATISDADGTLAELPVDADYLIHPVTVELQVTKFEWAVPPAMWISRAVADVLEADGVDLSGFLIYTPIGEPDGEWQRVGIQIND